MLHIWAISALSQPEALVLKLRYWVLGAKPARLPAQPEGPEGPEGLGTQFAITTKGQRPAGLHANRQAVGP